MLKNEPSFPPKVKITKNQRKEISGKLKELFREEVWINKAGELLVFCDNKHLLHPYIMELLSKYRIWLQMSLIDDEN